MSKTPAELKWLLVERASLAGRQNALLEANASLSLRLAPLRAELSMLEATENARALEIESLGRRIAALDTAVRLVSAGRVEPDVVTPIRPHSPNYGRRGALKEFVAESIQAAAPGIVTTGQLMELIAARFLLIFPTTEERSAYLTNTLLPALKPFRKAGLVERTQDLNGNWGWRWVRSQPSLQHLAALAAKQEVGRALGDSFGSEVAHKPVGRPGGQAREDRRPVG